MFARRFLLLTFPMQERMKGVIENLLILSSSLMCIFSQPILESFRRPEAHS